MKRFLWIGALLVTIAGIALTGYLTQAHFTGSIGSLCGEAQGCGVVLQSSWSQFAGLPTAFYGFCYYLLSFAFFLVFPVVDRKQKTQLLNSLLGFHLSAFLISLALISYAVVSLGANCLYCFSSFGLVTLLTGGTLFWIIRADDPDAAADLTPWYWQTATVVLLVGTLVLGGFVYSGSAPSSDTSDQSTRELTALINEGRSIGNPDAPIRVVEFFDLACPHCQRFTAKTFPKIKQDYIKTGKVVWTFRSFPITRAHPHSLRAHGILNMVSPNKFLEVKKGLMQDARRWTKRYTDNPEPYFNLLLSEYGLGSTGGPSDDLLRSIRFQTRDYADLGVRQTPSFLVNGRLYKGGLPYRRWRSIFDSLLGNQK